MESRKMLKDRKLLVEAEITKLTDVAAHMYLDAMISVSTLDPEYQSIRERITDLQHERKMIQLLIDKGHD
jgi:hypothetical protein